MHNLLKVEDNLVLVREKLGLGNNPADRDRQALDSNLAEHNSQGLDNSWVRGNHRQLRNNLLSNSLSLRSNRLNSLLLHPHLHHLPRDKQYEMLAVTF